MIKTMNRITDEPAWSQNIFDAQHLERWRQECEPLISAQSWEWCIQELRDKAYDMERSGIVLALDTGYRVCKTSSGVTESTRCDLVTQSLPLHERSRQSYGLSSDQTRYIVDPSLYPFIYNHTGSLLRGGTVGMQQDLFSYANIESFPEPYIKNMRSSEAFDGVVSYSHSHGDVWSKRFQWLPCEVEFTEDHGTQVSIKSYINNLEPDRHHALYKTIEKLISASIQPWNLVLVEQKYPRTPPRIRTYGYEFEPVYPEFALELDDDLDPTDPEFKKAYELTQEFLNEPEPDDDDGEFEESDSSFEAEMYDMSDVLTGDQLKFRVGWKWRRMKRVAHPEPGISFTYHDWLVGKTGRAIVEKKRYWDDDMEDLPPDEDHVYRDFRIQDQFRQRGLQIVIKMLNIDLTPSRSDFPGEEWGIDGMPNEHIVATSVYCYDEHNVSSAAFSFRQVADLDFVEIRHDKDWQGVDDVCEVFDIHNPQRFDQSDAYQHLGSVKCPQGRLLAWPNTLHPRLEPFDLMDTSQAGHKRFIIMSLVDPHYRIISTRNVPPQQHRWWFDRVADVFQDLRIGGKSIPQETIDHIEDFTGDWPMGSKQAEHLKDELLAEREAAQPWVKSGICFIDYFVV